MSISDDHFFHIPLDSSAVIVIQFVAVYFKQMKTVGNYLRLVIRGNVRTLEQATVTCFCMLSSFAIAT
jgi:hypothetical protein